MNSRSRGEERRREWAYVVRDVPGVVGKTDEWLVVATMQKVVKVVVKKGEKKKLGRDDFFSTLASYFSSLGQ